MTAPYAPSISPENKVRAAAVTQTTITLIGSSINTSDTYALVGSLQNGTMISQFVRRESNSATDNVTLGDLSPGNKYTLLIVSVIGKSTYCGANTTDSEKTLLRICTGEHKSIAFNTNQNEVKQFYIIRLLTNKHFD